MSFDLNTFKKAIHSHRGLKLSGQVAYRYINSGLLTKKMITTPLDSQYSHFRGHRFNFPYSFPALYMAFSEFVCILEAGQRPDPLATIFKNDEKEPAIIYSVRVTGNFANLVDKRCLEELSFDGDHPEYLIPTEDWEKANQTRKPAITHEIGQSIHDAGFDGIVYFSFPAWELRYLYNPGMISNVCIFMSPDNPWEPQNKTCILELYEPVLFTKKLTD